MSIPYDVFIPLAQQGQGYGSIVNEDDVETVATDIQAHVVHRWIMHPQFTVATVRSQGYEDILFGPSALGQVGGGGGSGCVYYGV